tara:strand:+ start:126 stop:230 length:105 start_codon:yes stop_codon:yes gene_type:complete
MSTLSLQFEKERQAALKKIKAAQKKKTTKTTETK